MIENIFLEGLVRLWRARETDTVGIEKLLNIIKAEKM